jgi:hypothetical protein
MMEILFFVLFYFALRIVLAPLFNPDEPITKNATPCPPHRWNNIKITDEFKQEHTRMICDKCKMPPGIG